MKMKLLVPTDFSNNAWTALTYACGLYQKQECIFYMLNAFTSPMFTLENTMVPEPGEFYYDSAKEESEKGLHEIIEKIKLLQKNPFHSFVAISIYNSPVQAIKQMVVNKDIDLVIMGTRGVADVKTLLFGSNTILVMKRLRNCPVLMIPKGVTYAKIKKIVFPTDFKTEIKKRELEYLIDIAKSNKSSVTVLHIMDAQRLTHQQRENKTILEAYFDSLNYKFHFSSAVNILLGLKNYIQNYDTDLVAFINKKHSFFRKTFTRSLVKSLGYNSEIPVLVMHESTN